LLGNLTRSPAYRHDDVQTPGDREPTRGIFSGGWAVAAPSSPATSTRATAVPSRLTANLTGERCAHELLNHLIRSREQ
jgi:hypothetical protein